MAAIADSFKKMYDFVKDTIIDNSPFGSLTEDDEYGEGEYEYYEDGNAVRELAPSYTPISTIEKHNETKVVSHPSINRGGNEVIVIEPRSFDDAATIVQHLKDRKIVMLNLHLLDKEQSQRTIDFVCGAAHALNGTAQKISDMVFIFTPSNVSLSVENGAVQSKFSEALWNKPL